eukprot:2664-Heterococcus_DN1.PRE.4
MDFVNMREVMRLSMVDHDITVQAGLGYVDLNAWLAKHGLWFPLDPGPGATLGDLKLSHAETAVCVFAAAAEHTGALAQQLCAMAQ